MSKSKVIEQKWKKFDTNNNDDYNDPKYEFTIAQLRASKLSGEL